MGSTNTEQDSGPWLGYEEAARYTSLSEPWLRELVMNKRIPFKKVGRRVLFSIPALDRWIVERDAESAA